MKVLTEKDIKITFLVVLLTNFFVFKFTKPIVAFRGETAA